MSNFKYNRIQTAFKLSNQLNKIVVAGRGVGKTTMLADENIDLLKNMPRGKNGFIGLLYMHIKTKSLPVMIAHWEKMGLQKEKHYFVGRKPPKSWKWNEAYMPPGDYKNSIIFWNGYTIEMISMDRPEIARSGSYDFMQGDEFCKLKNEALESDIMPANRGNFKRFGHYHRHNGFSFTTTHATRLQEEHIYKYEKLAKENPKEFLFLQGSALMNKEFLGEKYFRNLKRNMSEALYDLEVLNLRPKLRKDLFYPAYSDRTHTYQPIYNYNLLDDEEDNNGGIVETIDSRFDKDVRPNESLDISFDFGSRINTLVVAQEHFPMARVVRTFYVEQPKVMRHLVDKFINHYKHHKYKQVNLYGGSDGRRRGDYDSTMTYFDKVKEQLEKAGWLVIDKYRLTEINHKDKFLFFEDWMSGRLHHLPELTINFEHAKELIVSIKNSPLKDKEIEKDKSDEKKADIPQWKTTHFSDAFDNLFYWKYSEKGDNHSGFISTSIR